MSRRAWGGGPLKLGVWGGGGDLQLLTILYIKIFRECGRECGPKLPSTTGSIQIQVQGRFWLSLYQLIHVCFLK